MSFLRPERPLSVVPLQVLDGLEYMHSKSIGHLGLTPLDLLVSRPGMTSRIPRIQGWIFPIKTTFLGASEIKICDFSLSKRIVGIVRLEHGQPEYVAPEIVNGEGAAFASDMWSVGIITYLLLSGVSPFRGQVSSQFRSKWKLFYYIIMNYIKLNYFRMIGKHSNVSRWEILTLTLNCGRTSPGSNQVFFKFNVALRRS